MPRVSVAITWPVPGSNAAPDGVEIGDVPGSRSATPFHSHVWHPEVSMVSATVTARTSSQARANTKMEEPMAGDEFQDTPSHSCNCGGRNVPTTSTPRAVSAAIADTGEVEGTTVSAVN